MTRKALLTSLTLSEHPIAVVAPWRSHAIRGRLKTQPDGKTTSTTTGGLQVWQQHGGTWPWLARQRVRPPQAP